jgi:hypothetical protein
MSTVGVRDLAGRRPGVAAGDQAVAHVSELEVLLLWRALRTLRSGRKPACAPKGKPPLSPCPLFAECDRWAGPDDYTLSLDETAEETERRRSSWPCSRLLDLLSPGLTRLGGREQR